MKNELENINDIIIGNVETTSHNSVSMEEIFESIKSKLRFINELNEKYINDNDFGRNVRKFLNATK